MVTESLNSKKTAQKEVATQALSGRRRWCVYINTLKVGKWGLLSYSLAWTEVTWPTSH